MSNRNLKEKVTIDVRYNVCKEVSFQPNVLDNYLERLTQNEHEERFYITNCTLELKFYKGKVLAHVSI